MALRSWVVKISEATLEQFIRFRRLIVYILIIFFTLLEAHEALILKNGLLKVHLIELSLYLWLVIVIALLIELMLRNMKFQKRTINVFESKHKMSLELMIHDDWDSMLSEVTRHLGEVAEVDATYLYLREQISGQFENVAKWTDAGKGVDNIPLISNMICEYCRNRTVPGDERFIPCYRQARLDLPQVYCLQIYYGNELFGVVKFVLKPHQWFNKEQRIILGSFGDEIAIAFRAGQDRKKLLELQLAQTALAERHNFSQYLHDNLGQNIGYLRMKLGEFSNQANQPSQEDLFSDIARMKEIADESYNIIRNRLELVHPSTVPVLTNILTEHGKKISERANFEISFITQGTPRPVTINVRRAVFYVFQEALSNIEKHANASKVDVNLNWGKNKLVMTVSDNGVGFDPKTVKSKKNFGLAIVRERLANVNGEIDIKSKKKSGTVVQISVPFLVQAAKVNNE